VFFLQKNEAPPSSWGASHGPDNRGCIDHAFPVAAEQGDMTIKIKDKSRVKFEFDGLCCVVTFFIS